MNVIREWRKTSKKPRVSRFLAVSIYLFGAYLATGKLGLKLASLHVTATPVWPDSGIALAVFLLFGNRVWPAILIGSFGIYLTTIGTVGASIGIALGNTLEGLLGACLVVRFAGGVRFCRRSHSFFRFTILAGVVSTLIGATSGVATLVLAGFLDVNDVFAVWLTWWLGDAVGVILITPVIVLWSIGRLPRWRFRKLAELLGLTAALVLVGLAVFGEPISPATRNYPLEFLCVPILIAIAFRLGVMEASSAVLLLSVIAVWGTLQGHDPFLRASRNESLLWLQVFLGVVSIMSISVATVVSERKRVEKRLRRARKELARQATSDPLTGLANYRRFVNAFHGEISRSQRTGRSFALILFDLDGLKQINDAYGHLTGSRALYRVAEVLRLRCREVDTAAKYGGDEFALLLPETGIQRAQAVAERIVERLANDLEQPAISVSFGISVYPRDGDTFDKVFRVADAALYAMKRDRSGRDAIRR